MKLLPFEKGNILIKMVFPILLIGVTLFMLSACNQPNNDKPHDSVNEVESEDQQESAEEDADEIEKIGIEELSNLLIDAIDEQDMETVAAYVHADKGLLFSPYVYVTDDAVVLEASEVASMMDDDEVYEWGTYDGKGTPITLTPAEYFDEFMDMEPFQQPDDVLMNDLQDRGNTLNNVDDVFPDAEFIEYYHDGSEEYAGIDWSSILFVYEEDETGALQLIAIIRDTWTV